MKTEEQKSEFEKAIEKHLREETLKNIEWEFDVWIEKSTGECSLIGYDKGGNKYIGTGASHSGEIVEIYDYHITISDEFCEKLRKQGRLIE